MGVHNYNDLKTHIGHKFQCVSYGPDIDNVSLECVTCCEVMIDFNPEIPDEIEPEHEITEAQQEARDQRERMDDTMDMYRIAGIDG